MNSPFRFTLFEKQYRPAGSASEGDPGTEHENKEGESSKSGGQETLSDMSRSELDSRTVIRTRYSPGITQQVCSDKTRLGQEAQPAGLDPHKDPHKEGARQAQTYLLTYL